MRAHRGRSPRKAKRKEKQKVRDVPMSPMIDVVFLLLVYFVLTYQAAMDYHYFKVQRAQAGGATATPEILMYEIEVKPRVIPFGQPGSEPNYAMNGSGGLGLEDLKLILSRITPEETIAVICGSDSVHQDLVTVLDQCSVYGLRWPTILSAN